MHASVSDPLVDMLLARLERLSADSPWAHRAAGVRSALAREVERAGDRNREPSARVEALVKYGFKLLENATGDWHEPAATVSQVPSESENPKRGPA